MELRLSPIVAEERYTQTMTPPLSRISKMPPAEMRERYDAINGEHIKDVATFGRLRQFQVKVDETLAPLVKQ